MNTTIGGRGISSLNRDRACYLRFPGTAYGAGLHVVMASQTDLLVTGKVRDAGG